MRTQIIKIFYENSMIETDLVSVMVADDVCASNVCTWLLDAKAELERDNEDCDCRTGYKAEDYLDFLAEKGLIKSWAYVEEDDSVTL